MCASHVIIGDGIAGSSGAETIRELDTEADVTVLTEEGEALYNRILIKEFAKGKLPEAPVAIHDPDWYTERDIELHLDTVVTNVDTDTQEVTTHTGDVFQYDSLLVATGGTPSQLPVENSHADGIHHFWTFQDARRIREHVEEASSAVVVGAGLLGIDLAAICGVQEVETHYLMRGNTWWRYALTPTGAEIIHNALRDLGVTLVFESGVDRFVTDDYGTVNGVIDPNGVHYDCDFAGVAIGLDFNTEFLHDTPVELDNGIVVNEYMQTAVDNVFAAGDITQFYDLILEDRTQNGAWGSAKTQGNVAGTNMVTQKPTEVFEWVPTYSITHFDFPFLSFGHPTIGDDAVERKYGDTDWRRVVLKNNRVVGGVLIGNLSQQSTLKRLVRQQINVAGRESLLLEPTIDIDAFEEVPTTD